MSSKRLFLTGASGLLGRAINAAFKEEGWVIYGVGFSRVKGDLKKLDLTDEKAVFDAITSFKPTIVIHAAALRYPDVVDKQPDLAVTINVDTTKYVAQAAASVGSKVIYISTDYVFDGVSPPYFEHDKTNPLNLYGKTKLQGEEITFAVSSNNIVLRIPVLYGCVEKLSESAVTVLLELLQNSSKTVEVSDYERRRPSHVNDIAKICLQISTEIFKGCVNINGIYQWCGSEELTKYDMVLKMAKLFQFKHDHIKPISNPTSGSSTRPYNTTMDTSRLTSLGFGQHTPFDTGINDSLQQWVKNEC